MNKIISLSIAVLVAVAMVSIVVIPVIETNQGSFDKTETIEFQNTGTSLVKGNMADEYTFDLEKDYEEISKVYSSTNITWVVTTDGKLFGCGRNHYGQQGDGTTTDVTTFTQRLENETIASVSCSGSATWVVTTDGKLFGCGGNYNGEQGNGTSGSGTNVTTFTQRLSDQTIASVSCSNQTTWVVTTDGKLFGCGINSYSQQGDGTTTNVTTFTQRLSDQTVARVFCSANTTWAVTTDGKLYGCGSNTGGQQGDGTTTDVGTFTQRLSGETVKSVGCSTNITYVVTEDGKLYGCGKGSDGSQGNGTTTNVTTFTQKLDTEVIKSVYVENNPGTANNAVWAVTTDGKLYGCGDNGSGQQGDGTTTNVTTFTQRLSDQTVASVSCSYNATWAVTTDKKLYGCGNNSYGQQGDGTTSNVTSFTERRIGGSSSIVLKKGTTDMEVSGISRTGYDFYLGGNDWMLCTEGDDLVLYYAGLAEKKSWSTSVTLIFSNGSMTVSGEGSPTFTYTSIYYEGEGDYVIMGESAYVTTDTQIIGYAIPTNDSGIEVKGTVVAPEAISICTGTITVGNAVVTAADTDYNDLKTLTGLGATYNTDQTAECSSVIVPKEFSITVTEKNDMTYTILGIVPVFMLIAVMVAIVGFMMAKNRS